ncbi:uncharacterized protein LOC106178562 isoform X2 [Lingula anatina]|uniref:Uncharacterized protein LOC106178562 isoform X2 n=1 Tax=Lingula anatina TaxID=7574 RepID=A0A1S3K492_LINAN|nr:uncharacterized protein LOC106178562 isoform X2 [Lingula anatina]|eukprot:XP_013417234.1 uncharacterized protein LOC106178562 isoform X2 [Lingula anatina]
MIKDRPRRSLGKYSAHRRGGYAPPPDFFKRVLQLVQKLHRQRDKDNSSDRQAVKQSEMIVQGLLRKMHSHLWCLPESCLEEMKDWFEEMSQCPNCNQLIHRHPTYHKEYKELLPGVLTKIENLKSSNFSTDFCKFLDSIGPVDLVVDYLNIYGWGKPKVSMTELLHENYGFKNILFIVGVQMSIPIISRRIKVYQFQSRPKSEEDDLCVVYAAIKKRCPFLSKDRYVTHGDLEYSANGRLFHKWRFEHQLIYDDTQGPGYKIRPLCKVQPKPLMHAAHCHIPGISYAGVTSDDDMFPIKWLCLRKVDESGTSLE